MNLGERIHKFRTEKSLSQGDLAQMLEVSRQSVSKWENNNSVPELEKIIKLSEIFEVSLDVLVKGEEPPCKVETVIPVVEVEVEQKPKESEFPPRKIAGTILLCMAFLVTMFFLIAGGGFAGIIFALPFLTCGILCFLLEKNLGLWCAWDVYLLFDIYMSYATGIHRASVLHTFQWTSQMNYMRLLFAWILVVSLAVLVAVTIMQFRKKPFSSEKKGRNQLVIVWLILAVLQILSMIWVHTELYKYIIENIFEMSVLYRLITIVFSWSRIIVFTVALVFTVRFLEMKKQELLSYKDKNNKEV